MITGSNTLEPRRNPAPATTPNSSSKGRQYFYSLLIIMAAMGPFPLPEMALFILIFLNSLKMNLARYFVQVLLVTCAIIYGFLVDWTFERVPDLKLFLLLAAVLGYNYSKGNIDLDKLVRFFIYINIATLLYSLAFGGPLLRYTNSLPFAGQSSIYYGFLAFSLYTVATRKQKGILAILILLINSGTVLVGLLVYEILTRLIYANKNRKNAFKQIATFIGGAAVISVLISALLIGQQETRGRSLSAITSIDRVILGNNSVQFIKRNFDLEHYFLGCYWSCDLKKMTTEFDITFSPIGERTRGYAANEGQGFIQPKNVHSDIFRTILAFGFTGFILTYVFLYLALGRNLALLGSILLMGFFNNLLFITPCIIGILIMSWGRTSRSN